MIQCTTLDSRTIAATPRMPLCRDERPKGQDWLTYVYHFKALKLSRQYLGR